MIPKSKGILRTGLLIEPVWNRNQQKTRVLSRKPSSFNRTSMESKRRSVCLLVCLPFNRTSMESKLNRISPA